MRHGQQGWDILRFLGAACVLAFVMVAPSWADGFKEYEKGRFDKAEEAFRRQAEDSTQAGPRYNLGNALYRQGRFEEASKAYEEALKKDPRLYQGWYNLGNALYQQNRYRDAIEAFNRALSIRDHEDARFNLKKAEIKMKQDPQGDKSPPKKQEPQATQTPKPGGKSDDDMDGQKLEKDGKKDPKGDKWMKDKEGKDGRTQTDPEGDRQGDKPGTSESKERQQRQDQAREELGMSDKQVKDKLDQLSRQEKQLQSYFNRNPHRRQAQDDPFKDAPPYQKALLKHFFGDHYGQNQGADAPEKDW